MTVIPIAQCPVRRRVNLFGCCYLCLMSTNCLYEHARARACARPAPTLTRSIPGILFKY